MELTVDVIVFTETKRRKVDSIPKEGRRAAEPGVEKKERSSKTKVRDDQKELRREKKLGRKRVRKYFYYKINLIIKNNYIFKESEIY